MRRTVSYVLILLLACSVPASGQLAGVQPVVEVGPTAQNATITAIQSTITAIESVLHSFYMALELEPLTDIAIAADYAETLALLVELVAEGEALMGDAAQAQAQIEALFHLDTPARTLPEFHERITEIKRVSYEARVYAIRVQTLIRTLTNTLSHLANIVSIIGALTGNMAANQSMVQLLAIANQTLATQTAQTAAQHRADVLDRLARGYVVESYRVIEASRWADWPTL